MRPNSPTIPVGPTDIAAPEGKLHSPTTARRRLLMIAYWYPPENESGALRPARFCKYLPEYGYEPLVVAAANSNAHGGSQTVLRVPDPNSDHRAAAWLAGLGRGLQRLLPYNDCLEWVPHAVAAAAPRLFGGEFPVIMSTSPPVATHITALWLKRRFKVKWIADFRDPIGGNPFRTRPHGRIYDALVERSILSQADAIIVNTDATLEMLGQRYRRYRHKICVIWNGYDPDDNLVAAPIPPRDHRVIAHFGSIYGGRHPGKLVDSLQRLIQRNSIARQDIHLSLVGSIDRDKPWVSQSAFSELVQAGNLEYTDRALPREEANRRMKETDYLLLLDLNEMETGLQVPAKLFEYIRIGRPILAFTTKSSPVDRILRQSGAPHVCVYSDDPSDEIDRKVLALLSMPREPTSPSSWFEEQFDARQQTGLLAAVLDSVMRGVG